MKLFPYIITALFIGFVVFLWVNDKNMRETLIGEQEKGTQCYVWSTPSGDKATLRFLSLEEGKVSGFLSYRPAQKDSKVGTFVGSRTQQGALTVINGTWDVRAEGMSAREELSLMIEEPYAKIGFGEMKESTDGIYRYANPSAINYSLTLERRDCTDPVVERPESIDTTAVVKDGGIRALMSNTWVWEKTVRGTGTTTPKKAGVFTLSFDHNNSVHGTTDCNSFGGSVAITGDELSFGPFASTLMYCDKAQEGVFTGDLAQVGRYMFDAEGHLILIFKDGTGSITLSKSR